MESGRKQLGVSSRAHAFTRPSGAAESCSFHERDSGCLVNPLALSSACWEGVGTNGELTVGCFGFLNLSG